MMSDRMNLAGILNEKDSIEQQNTKLMRIVSKLITRVEKVTNDNDASYMHFERAIILENIVRLRTGDLRDALNKLNQTNLQLEKASSEAEKTRKDLADAVEAIQEGFAIFDNQDMLILKNTKFLSLLGDVVEHVVSGINFSEYVLLCANSKAMIFEDDQAKEEWIRQRTESHQKVSSNFNLRLQDDHWLQVSEQKTSANGTIILHTDITDMVRLERKNRDKILDEQANIVKLTLQHINQSIVIFDADQLLTGWNDKLQHIFNIPAILLHKGTRASRFESVFLSSLEDSSTELALIIFKWIGTSMKRNILRQVIVTTTGKTLDVFGQEMPGGSIVISFTDISNLRDAMAALNEANETLEHRVKSRTQELKAARDSAQRANASKSRFVAAASHDLLQPINAAKLFISALSHTDLNEKQDNIVERISKSFESVETILGALLDISKLDLNAIEPNISYFQIDPILSQLGNEFDGIAKDKGIELRIMPSSLCTASDPVYFRRILQNLVSNAIRYTIRGRVLVGVKRVGNQLKIIVQDTGIGIAKDDQKKIFLEFHRVSSSINNVAAMGLGLAIVERACHLLSHPITLESEIGKGTQFNILVPFVRRSNLSKDQDDIIVNNNQSNLRNKIILIIENDISVREGMVTLLENWEATTLQAETLSTAVQKIEEIGFTPDAVIADYHLDTENGIEVIEALRQRYGTFLSILLTADHSASVKLESNMKNIALQHKPINVLSLKELLLKA